MAPWLAVSVTSTPWRTGAGGAKIIPYPTWQAALDDAKAGKIDAALFIRSPASSGDADITGLNWGFVDDVVHEYHIAVHKGDARTLEKINEALATVRANGTFDRIYAKWIGPLEPHPIRLADLKPYYFPLSLGAGRITDLVCLAEAYGAAVSPAGSGVARK